MNLEILAKVAESKIQEAIEEGKFDNLPGKGKPLNLEEDTNTPAHMRMANKILKNAGVLPEWMQIGKDIGQDREEAEKFSARIIRENRVRRSRLDGLPPDHPSVTEFDVWHARQRDNYLRRLKQINTSVLKFSMLAPSTATPFIPVRIEPTMASFDAEFLPLEKPLSPAEQPAPDASAQAGLKSVARARYQAGNGGGPVRGWARTARLFGGGTRVSDEPEAFDVDEIRRSERL